MIRNITLDDEEIFLELGKEFYKSNAVSSEIATKTIYKTFENIISDSPFIKGYLIIIKDKVVGFFTISFGFATEYGGNVLFFEDLYIRRAYQSQGIGSKVFEYLEQTYKDEVEAIKLEVAKNNKKAIKLYRKLGYFDNEYVSMLKRV